MNETLKNKVTIKKPVMKVDIKVFSLLFAFIAYMLTFKKL